jgi:hypothetical protein
MNEGRQRACAKSRPRLWGENIRKRYLLSEYASYANIFLMTYIQTSNRMGKHGCDNN